MKENARIAVRRAVKSGILIKPKRCVRCNKQRPLMGHHHRGYARRFWLSVIWLCRSCHFKEHKCWSINIKRRRGHGCGWYTHPENIRYGRENPAFIYRYKLQGGRHPNSKLTAQQVQAIHVSCLSGAELGRRYGITTAQACGIKRGSTWRYLWEGRNFE